MYNMCVCRSVGQWKMENDMNRPRNNYTCPYEIRDTHTLRMYGYDHDHDDDVNDDDDEDADDDIEC